LAIGRGPASFLQKQAVLKMGKHNSIAINDNYKTSMERVFAAGDVTGGETLVVMAMESGREAAQRVHECLMALKINTFLSMRDITSRICMIECLKERLTRISLQTRIYTSFLTIRLQLLPEADDVPYSIRYR
jgi:hypothetical protein